MTNDKLHQMELKAIIHSGIHLSDHEELIKILKNFLNITKGW